ncbi:acyl-CoA dehydrogenase family protein [Arthrobacter mobilis]|uniref:Acyl-CoA dehydrogenase n=1 Tax=Arthrobacter mobilis TaxID=2724944 RepID=A0A7X6K7N1_9MICC|nr:acyl-CoA dehydrogenase family protein [Arthrobacter mobilis]NKX56665.1 acyl-CoA dehydrogenase [Arthrobacter mobilis]
MDFHVSEDDRQFLKDVTAFVDDEVIPVADKMDAAEQYPGELVDRMRQLGFFSASSRCLVTYSLALEELARGWLSLIPIANAHTSSVWTLKHHGTPGQQAGWLPDLLSGAIISCLALTEPHGGSDLQNIRSTARRTTAGWVIDAHKTLITHSDHSDSMLILARTDEHVQGHRGLSLFLLKRDEWVVQRKLPKLGTKGIETCELKVQGVEIPHDRLVGGQTGKGFGQVMDALEVGRIAVASAAVGVGRSALWNAVEYIRQREAFGTRVADMPAVRSDVAKVGNQLAAAKALTLWSAVLKQNGGRHDVETSSAKVVATDAAVAASLKAMELAGGNGYTEDYRFARILRDTALFLAGEGSNGVLNSLIGSRLVSGEKNLAWI